MIKAGVACRARADALEAYLAEQAGGVASAGGTGDAAGEQASSAGEAKREVAAEFGY